ncbi:MAG: L-dopachrome tautomerase-related protein [Pseudomonadota bacterium]
MQHIFRFKFTPTAVAALACAIATTACGGGSSNAKGQASLEVYAELQQAGIGGISQMPDGQLIVGYHPFYQTATSTQVALLNADRKSTTPYPAGLRQTCRNADESFVAPVGGKYDFCLDWVLGFHTDANGILWILDSAKSTDKAGGAITRPAALRAKLVGWNTKTNVLHKIIDLDASTVTESQHNDFAVDLAHNVIVIADEAIGENSDGAGLKAALVVVDLATGTSRRLLQGDVSVLPHADPIRWEAQAGQPAGSWGLRVGVDGIALDKNNDYLYYAPLSAYRMYRIRMADLLNTALTPAQLSAKVEDYAAKPYNGGLSIDTSNNLYLTEVGGRSVGIIPADTKTYRRYVTDDKMIWPDGVTYNTDGFMYSGAAQLIQTGVFQAKATPKGSANNAPPYRIYRFRPEAVGTPGS